METKPIEPQPPKSRSGCLKLSLIIGGVLFIGFIIFAFLAIALAPDATGRGVIVEVIEPAPAGVRERVAEVQVSGMISNALSGSGRSMVDDFKDELREALEDKRVKAIVVRVNSPGGEVTASDILYKAVKDANAIKPVVIYMETLAASGGYYLACGGRHIMAGETTLTGSIGVAWQAINVEEMMDKIGLDVLVFKSGEFKDMLSPAREVTEPERDYIQSLVIENYDRFLAIVSEARDIPVEELRDSELADGRVYTGAQALKWGMVDSTGYIEDAYQQAMTEAGIENAAVVRFRRRPGLFDSLGFPFASSEEGDRHLEVRFSPNPLPEMQTGVPYYLYLPRQ